MEHKEDIQDDIDGLLYETFRNVSEAKGSKKGPNMNVKSYKFDS